MIIDWNKLQPYKSSKNKSFEQLCYQVASRLYTGKGSFTPIDDSGGGDGVEFYLTLPDGVQYGWQAKFYDGSKRLTGSRKQHILESLKKALSVHPGMTEWYLCLPTDLTTAEQVWANTALSEKVAANRKLKITYWTETFLHGKINEPAFNGLKNTFFNELELSAEWFKRTFDNQFLAVKNKFEELLYTPNEAFEYDYIDPLLCNRKFVENRIDYYPGTLLGLYEKVLAGVERLSPSYKRLQHFIDEHKSLFKILLEGMATVLPKIQERMQQLSPNRIMELSDTFFENAIDNIKANQEAVQNCSRQAQANMASLDEQTRIQQAAEFRKIGTLLHICDEFCQELRYFISHSAMPLEQRVTHFLGRGGDGKTNLAIAITKEVISNGSPAIFIPAIKLTGTDALQAQLLTLLDIKPSYSFAELLDTLDALGRLYNCRVPFIIDGLNESQNSHGMLNERLKMDLPVIEQEFLLRPNLVLITTCRPSYKFAIWGAAVSGECIGRFPSLRGFMEQDIKKKLVQKYFDFYKIEADLSFASLQKFSKPLYLKIFCEAMNPPRQDTVHVMLANDSIYTIFEKFVQACDDSIFRRLQKRGLAPVSANKKIATHALRNFAASLWHHPDRYIPLEEVMGMLGESAAGDFNRSKTKALLEEELLFIRDHGSDSEHVTLTYDLLAGYFIASYLVETVSNFIEFFSGNEVNLIAGNDETKLHPNYEDITAALCFLLPARKNVYAHDIIRAAGQEQRLKALSIESVFCTLVMPPVHITAAQIDMVSGLANRPQNLIRFINHAAEVFFLPTHPFNFNFWAQKLAALPMNERDLHWSEYLRSLGTDEVSGLLEEFSTLLQQEKLTPLQEAKVHLVAAYISWSFTSTSTKLKQKLAKSLYYFAVRYPLLFLERYYASAAANDPSIFEWMGPVLYNMCIYRLKASAAECFTAFEQLADFLAKEILSKEGRYATSHLAIRSDSLHILGLLRKKIPGLAEKIDMVILRAGLKQTGITVWQTAVDPNTKEYRNGNALIDYFFEKEKMPSLETGKGNQHNPSPAYKRTKARLRWRAYSLGYSLETFGRIDQDIAKQKHWGGEFAGTARYADKYLDIAFQEYCGYADSRGKLKNYEDIGYARLFDLKFDPLESTHGKQQPEAAQFISKNFIDHNGNLSDWLKDHSVPTLNEYVFPKEFPGKKGDWVALYLFAHQHDKKTERQIYFFHDAVFVKQKDLPKARKAFTIDTKLGFAAHTAPFSVNIHVSEIPDGPAIPLNKFKKWYYSISSKKINRSYEKITLSKDGQQIDDAEADLLWQSLGNSLGYVGHFRVSMAGYALPDIRISLSSQATQPTLIDALQKLGITTGKEYFEEEEDQPVDKSINVFTPVRSMKEQVYLCKNIIEAFGLSTLPGSPDLIDANGVLASFSQAYRRSGEEQESLSYIRRDLLEQYLDKEKLAMFFIEWGERSWYPPNGDYSTHKWTGDEKWAKFYEAKEYLRYI